MELVEGGARQNETDRLGAASGIARNVASCLEMMGVEIRALVAHDLVHRSRTPVETVKPYKQFAAWPGVFSGACDWMRPT